jgi:hypothetical protein
LGIRLKKTDLAVALDSANAVARSKQKLPSEWLHAVQRIEECPSKTYVAALGAAMLAKATNAKVDSLALKQEAGPRGYPLRSVAEFMASQATRYGYHLGATGKWPLNNSPFYRNNNRIDRFTGIKAADRPYYEDFVRYLQDLNRLDEKKAQLALAAFLRRRVAFARALSKQVATVLTTAGAAYAEVVEIARLFCTEKPEGGKRGQALVAALFDCVYPSVDLKGINNPRPLDVRVMRGKQILLGAEVKQVVVDEEDALRVALEAQQLRCDKALLVAIADKQPLLDRDGLRHDALDDHGVLLEVVHAVPELFALVTTFASATAADVAERFPQAYAKRLQEHDVSKDGQARWASLVAGLASSSP